MAIPVRSELKTGQRPVQQQIRTLKPGEVLFEEGTFGKELFIIQDGVVGVYKDTPDGKVELARIEKGGIIGEMSLLDNLPRSATVTAIETSKVTVVNQATFQSVLQALPVWLSSIIKIVVSRLRDANKRVDQAVLRDKERGLLSLMLLLLPGHKREMASRLALEYDLVAIEAFYVCRLRKKEIRKVIDNLKKRTLIEEEEDPKAGTHYLFIKDVEVLRLFEEFLNLKNQKKSFRETGVPDESVAMLSNIAYVAQKSGRETEDGTVLMKSAILDDLAEKTPEKLEKNLLDLRRRNLINMMPSDNDEVIIFRKDTLSRIKKIKEWLPRFEMVLE